jgi:hypothetical protein
MLKNIFTIKDPSGGSVLEASFSVTLECMVTNTVSVRSRGGPELTSECCVSLTWMVMQGEYMGIYHGSGKEGPTSSGEGESLYFLAPKCLHRGYKL